MLVPLGALAALAARRPLLMIMSTGFAGDHSVGELRTALRGLLVRSIDLGPLASDDAMRLAAGAASISEALLRSCVERAYCNPLCLEQLLLNAGDEGSTSLPGSIQALSEERMDRLAPADKNALHAAAVWGHGFRCRRFAAWWPTRGTTTGCWRSSFCYAREATNKCLATLYFKMALMLPCCMHGAGNRICWQRNGSSHATWRWPPSISSGPRMPGRPRLICARANCWPMSFTTHRHLSWSKADCGMPRTGNRLFRSSWRALDCCWRLVVRPKPQAPGPWR